MKDDKQPKTGTLYGLGVGPGDPELLTLKAHRVLTASPVVAYPKPDTGQSFARSIVASYLKPDQREIAIEVPMRVERFPAAEIYDRAADEIAAALNGGEDVAVLCEGDPFFYGSFMYLFERLAGRFKTIVVPGVSSIMAASAASARPLAARNDRLTVIPGPLPDEELIARIESAEAFAIMKLGRHFARIRHVIDRMGLTERCRYCERLSMPEEIVLPLAYAPETAPYFSMILGYRGSEPAIVNASLPNFARRDEESVGQ
ncbi:cobalamin biosynthesis precorrin-2 methyltransferase [Fulvimarina pelagi HTCC2506]|uniref:Cobalamin biosynthesis precorrin-2 methyltransferase n=1 Tax=Fulvimarina pelagi HTCC2506 TaxID=314231 RepID=Q0G5M5_9HYPH|nr:precorrin-2 C(20)-methyltransferase [Fulvimarina pelagi]EAU43039.1 cobalamin biosynthesis precorrin-2 methyltransferase [Fulvimarina pelagi HTCC2506]